MRRVAWILAPIWALAVATGILSVFAVPLLLATTMVYASFVACLGLWFSTVCGSTMRAGSTPLTNTMGVETMLEHTWSNRMRFMRDDNMDDPFESWKAGRIARFKQVKPLFLLIIAGSWLATGPSRSSPAARGADAAAPDSAGHVRSVGSTG